MPFPRKPHYIIVPLSYIPYDISTLFDSGCRATNTNDDTLRSSSCPNHRRIEPTLLSYICRSIRQSEPSFDNTHNPSLSLQEEGVDTVLIHRSTQPSNESLSDEFGLPFSSSASSLLPSEFSSSSASSRFQRSLASTASTVPSFHFIEERLRQAQGEGHVLINRFVKMLMEYHTIHHPTPSFPAVTDNPANRIFPSDYSGSINEPYLPMNNPSYKAFDFTDTQNVSTKSSTPTIVKRKEKGTDFSSNTSTSSGTLRRTKERSSATSTLTSTSSALSFLPTAPIILGKRTRHHTDAYTTAFTMNNSSFVSLNPNEPSSNISSSSLRNPSVYDDSTSTYGEDAFFDTFGHHNNGGNLIFQQGKPLPPHISKVLVTWFLAHSTNPYPTNEEKTLLMEQTGLNSTQLRNWFTNQRKRHWRPVAREGRTPRNQMEAILLSSSHQTTVEDNHLGKNGRSNVSGPAGRRSYGK